MQNSGGPDRFLNGSVRMIVGDVASKMQDTCKFGCKL